jgi:hypothetical protein
MSCSCDNNPLILPVGATGPQGPQGVPGPGFVHYIGEEFGGGIIFHLYKDSLGVEHGLVVSTLDQSSGSAYSSNDATACGALSTWDGQENTNKMKTQGGAFGIGAWRLCDEYTVIVDSITYGDWYLPAIDELNLLFNNRFNVNRTLSGNSSFGSISGATQIDYNGCWSSTEDGSSSAVYFLFVDDGFTFLQIFFQKFAQTRNHIVPIGIGCFRKCNKVTGNEDAPNKWEAK